MIQMDGVGSAAREGEESPGTVIVLAALLAFWVILG